MTQFHENAWVDEGWTEGQKDRQKERQTLFYRTLMPTAGVQKKGLRITPA